MVNAGATLGQYTMTNVVSWLVQYIHRWFNKGGEGRNVEGGVQGHHGAKPGPILLLNNIPNYKIFRFKPL